MAKENESTKPETIVKIEDAGPCRKKVSIEIPQQAIKEATDEQYSTIGKDAEVPGFRKGRAPRRLLEKRFGKDITEQVKLKLLAEASDQAIKDNELDILGEPDIDYENIELPGDGPLKFEFELETRPEFDLPELDGIPVNKSKLEVTDEQIDREIEQLRKWSGVWAPRDEDQAVETDDQIIANAILQIEGVEQEEKIDNTEIYVRSHGYVGSVPVEGLDELLVGAKIGDEKETSVEVPKTYFKEEYRGKKVDVKIEIKDIKWLKPAEMDQDFLSRFAVEDEDQLRERMRDSLQERLEQQVRSDMSDQITKYMLENTTLDLPTSIVADQAQSLLTRQQINLMQKGMSREKIEEQMDQLKSSSEQQAEENLKSFFIMDKVAEKLEIETTEEEINGHIAQLAIQQGQRPEKMREQMERNGSLAQFRMQVRTDKCVAKLLETANITEVEPEKPAKQAKKAKKTTKKTTKKKTDKKTEAKDTAEKKPAKKTKKKAKKKTDK